MWKTSGILLLSRRQGAVFGRSNEFLPVGSAAYATNPSAGGSTTPPKQAAVPAIPEQLRSGLQASYAKGTGGRSSYSGNVCTVFGATGFFGKYIVNLLGYEGTQIIIPYRCDASLVRELKLSGDLGQVLFFPFQIGDEQSIRKVVKYSNIVVNCIGFEYDTYNYTIENSNADSARTIAKVCREMGVRRLIHLSAMNASFEPEEHLLPGGSPFLKAKALSEKYVRDEFPDATIVRPSDMHGWKDKFSHPFCHAFRRNIFYRYAMYRKGDHTYKAPVDAQNVAQGIMYLIHDPTSDGKTYEFCGPHWYRVGDIVDWLYRHIGRHDVMTYGRQHLDAWFGIKTNLYKIKQWITKNQVPCEWDSVERKEATSDLLTGCPTLSDFGFTLFTIEERIPYHIIMYNRKKAYKPDIGEFPEPPWPQRFAPMYKTGAPKLTEKFETIVKPVPQFIG